MFILNYFKSFLCSLGLYKKNAKILFLGLDNAGKTTLLRKLKDGRMIQHDPTLQPHVEELVLGQIRFKAFDLGGHKAVRTTWKNYFPTVNGIFYLVDSSNRSRFEESRRELEYILNNPQLENVPIIVFGNKIDCPQTVSQEEFSDYFLNIPILKDQKDRKIMIFMCSVANSIGYQDGFRWLSNFLK